MQRRDNQIQIDTGGESGLFQESMIKVQNDLENKQLSTEDLDRKLELMFNRVEFLNSQVNHYESQNKSIKDQMEKEIKKNKTVEESVNESISEVNEGLVNLNSKIELIGEKKVFLEKSLSQIKITKLVQMENDFLRNENTHLKNQINDSQKNIEIYIKNEKEEYLIKENLKRNLKEITQNYELLQNKYDSVIVSNDSVEQQLMILQKRHNALLADYEILEKENRKYKLPLSHARVNIVYQPFTK